MVYEHFPQKVAAKLLGIEPEKLRHWYRTFDTPSARQDGFSTNALIAYEVIRVLLLDLHFEIKDLLQWKVHTILPAIIDQFTVESLKDHRVVVDFKHSITRIVDPDTYQHNPFRWDYEEIISIKLDPIIEKIDHALMHF